ncbi:MAG: M20 family metallopeptidase [Candidatus Omnitrophica bacterium]|nr:M20 family metallopeptidase [Candidatus Omnitrophota bacterium]
MNKELIKLTQRLIRIDSSNPPGKEKEIALFIERYIKNLKFTSKLYEFERNRPNLVCKIPSLRSKKKLLITPHIDTVPPSGKWRFSPFSGKIYRGRIYGRGASDDKGNVAVALYLIKLLREKKIRLKNLDLIIAFTADEETGSKVGIKPLLNYLGKIDYGLVLDSDDFEIVIAQKGLLHLRVEIFGKEAHGAYPERGINAIEKSVYILNELLQEDWENKVHPLLKRPTINIGRICGGEKVNVVAGFNFFELDIRYIPSMNKKNIEKKLRKIIEKYTRKYRIKILAHQKPLEIAKNHFLIKLMRKVLKRHKIKVSYKASLGATVINFLSERGIEGFCFGFGSKGYAHSANEYVKIKNLYGGVEVLKDYVLSLDDYAGR